MSLDLQKFSNWITQRGAEILPCLNDRELIRFRGSKTGVIYKSGKAHGKYVNEAIECFQTNSEWGGKPARNPKIGSYDRKTIRGIILQRDGDCCFYCGKRFIYYMGKISLPDITIEHLIPLSSGGTNLLSNLVLCHKSCNEDLGNIHLSEKVKIAINNRLKLIMDDPAKT